MIAREMDEDARRIRRPKMVVWQNLPFQTTAAVHILGYLENSRLNPPRWPYVFFLHPRTYIFLFGLLLQRRGRRGRGKPNRNAAQPAEDDDDRGMLERADMHNERFTAYYQAQKIILDDEWEAFMDSLRRPLPTTFRIAGSRQCGLSLSMD